MKIIKNKKKYIKPEIQTDAIYETRALGCGMCLNEEPPETHSEYLGECSVSTSSY